jgi:hypothetical protein
MTASIPASQLVNVVPGVLGAGGSPLALNSVFLTNNSSIPIGTVQSFATLADVQAWFGPSSTEAALAAVYFNGFDGASLLPGLLYFAQYAAANVGAYLRSGSLASMTLAQLQALSGTLVTVVNGVSSTSLAINLAGATSFSNAAALIQTGIQGGTPSSTATVTYDAQLAAFVIRSSTTGTGSTIAFATGTLAAGIKLQAAQGAVLSQGALASTPSGILTTVTGVTLNWACLTTVFEPVVADKVLFAQAIDALGQRFVYVGWDTANGPTAAVDPTSFAALTAALNGRVAIWGTADKAAFFCGATAAINFDQTNGRITYAYKSQSGLTPDVTNATVANNLIANGYNFYGAYATANDQFQFLQNGSISGTWKWADNYVNQIKLNSDLQLAFVTLLNQVKSVPYVTRGYDLLRAAALDPITSALNFGSIVAGVTLSASQKAQINTAAGGVDISTTLQSRGWYLLIQDAAPATRALRNSPPMTLWYTDGGSVQKINLASIDVQ